MTVCSGRRKARYLIINNVLNTIKVLRMLQAIENVSDSQGSIMTGSSGIFYALLGMECVNVLQECSFQLRSIVNTYIIRIFQLRTGIE